MRCKYEGKVFGASTTEEIRKSLGQVYNHKKHSTLLSGDSFIASQILGDGHLVVRRKHPRKDGSIPLELAFSHSAQKAGNYTLFKWEVAASLGFKPWAIALDSGNSRYGGPQLKSGFSIKDQKWIDMQPLDLVKFLDPFGILLWYLDDGTMHPKRSGYIHSNMFDLDTNEKIAEFLNKKFGFNLSASEAYHKDKGKSFSYLEVHAADFRLLIDLNSTKIPYVPQCMWYKIDMHYRYSKDPVYNELKYSYDFPTGEDR